MFALLKEMLLKILKVKPLFLVSCKDMSGCCDSNDPSVQAWTQGGMGVRGGGLGVPNDVLINSLILSAERRYLHKSTLGGV